MKDLCRSPRGHTIITVPAKIGTTKTTVTDKRPRQTILALDRERQRISKSSDYKTVVPLDEPYQKGWKRLFVLRPEVQQSSKAEFYQQILNTINTVQYHYDQSFKKPKRKGRWHKYYFDELPKLQAIEEYYWGAKKPPFSEEQRACFNKVKFWDESYYRWEYKYVFTQPDLFTVAVLPHMVTTVIIGDALLEQRLAWIDDHIKGFAQENRLRSMKGGWYKYWKSWVYIEKLKNVNPLKNKPKWSWEEE